MTTKKEYQGFLNENYNDLEIKAGLFFNWNKGLRFDLQVGETNTDEYFEEVFRRSSTLFKSLFEPEDKVFLVLMDYKYKRNKIRYNNFCFKQIQMLQKSEVVYFKASKLYEPKDDTDVRNIAVAKVLAKRINFLSILKAIANTDFPPRETETR